MTRLEDELDQDRNGTEADLVTEGLSLIDIDDRPVRTLLELLGCSKDEALEAGLSEKDAEIEFKIGVKL